MTDKIPDDVMEEAAKIIGNLWHYSKTECIERLADYLQQRAVPEWLPIESAPKNKMILAFLLAGDHASYQDAIWWHKNEWVDGSDNLRTLRPTHWMPLPAAPKDEKD